MLEKSKETIDLARQDKKLQGNSDAWVNWEAVFSLTTCKHCLSRHGSILAAIEAKKRNGIPAHKNCCCAWVLMRTCATGTATELGFAGADAALMYRGELPEYYVSKDVAEAAGWISWKGNLAEVLPGYMIGGDIYHNKSKKLPDAPGRVWYEADINYESGFRNRQRILYSNDGLIFASYDHYHTFYEITK